MRETAHILIDDICDPLGYENVLHFLTISKEHWERREPFYEIKTHFA
jgi:hypothetical protein